GVTRVVRSVFARQMHALARSGWRTVPLGAFVTRLQRGIAASDHEFLLSFDDGYASLADNAYPVLADVGFTATTFLVTDFVGRSLAYPFGASDQRVERLARAAGYDVGFGGVRANGSALGLARVPVYLWDVGDTPLGLRGDAIGDLGRLVAHVANRCAVGTSW